MRKLLAVLAMCVPLCTAASAADWPADRPIRYVVPFGAGGAMDVMSRTLADTLSQRIGQKVVVVNVPGAGGSVGTNEVARAAPDGYTLGIVTTGQATQPALGVKLPYKPVDDFTPIALIAIAPNVLVVHPSMPVSNVAQLIERAKAKPGDLTFGSAGLAGFQSALIQLSLASGIKVQTVPFSSGTAAVAEVVAGRLDFMFGNILEVVEQVKAGKLKALAVTSAVRTPLLPDVPTMVEQGFADIHTDSWFGLLGPAGMPPELVAKMNKDINDALKDPKLVERFQTLGTSTVVQSSGEWGSFLRAQVDKWGPIVKESGFKVPQ